MRERADAGTDDEGRRVFRASTPEGVLLLAGYETDGASEVHLTLDAAGDPAVVEIVARVEASPVRVRVELSRFGADMARLPPAAEPPSVTGPVTAEEVRQAGIVGAVELSEVPSGWSLQAMALEVGSPREGCSRLSLDYGSPDVDETFGLDVSTTGCSAYPEPWDAPYSVGPWSGTITDDDSDYTIGEVTDGTTIVEFTTTADMATITTLLSGLEAFDPTTTPTPIAATPT